MRSCKLKTASIHGTAMALITLLELFLAAISFVILRCLLNKDGQPINWPVIGMLPDSVCNIHQLHDRFTEVLEKSGFTFLYKGPWFSNVKILGTVDPANIHYIMSSNFSNFPKGHEFSKIKPLFGAACLAFGLETAKHLQSAEKDAFCK